MWSVEDLARHLQVSPNTVYVWNYKGTGPRAVRVGRHVRYRAEDVETWLERHANSPRLPAA